ncbi:MAG TPA: hypothetical protein VE712_04795, partial [Actinomycetota bacterium]|nr:hypothetical protein [Actinomycetota bacterium]
AACGYEALTRFPAQPELDIGAWFKVAGQLQRSGRLEAIVVASALSAREDVPAGCFLSINLSPAAIASQEVTERLEGEGEGEGPGPTSNGPDPERSASDLGLVLPS